MEKAIQMMVQKRNGEVVEFNPDKIRIAISKAMRATKIDVSEEKIEEILSEILSEIENRFRDFYPNVENVQDIVEKNLMKKEFYEVAKAYILYRNERNKERERKVEENIEKAKVGGLQVRKETGQVVNFDIDKIRAILSEASRGHEKDISSELVIKEFMKNIYDGITTKDISKALVLASTAFIEKDPAYSYVSARLFMKSLFKEVTGESDRNNKIETYRNSFKYVIQKGVEEKMLDSRMKEYNLDKLALAIRPERDEIFQFMGLQTLYERYLLKINKKRIELPQVFWMRVAMGLALPEKEKDERAIEFYEVLSSMRFVSSTPTLFHSGTTHPQLSSCYLNTVMDDLKHIFKVYGDNAQMSKWSGGIGTDWTNIRSIGSIIKSNKIESQGVIPFLKIANDVTVAISRSGKRRGATCAYMETWHMDFEDFLDLRKNTGDERRRTHDMNTANWIPDLFMKRVVNDEEWSLFSPDETPDLHHIYGKDFEKRYKLYEEKATRGEIKSKKISAKKLWRKMLSMLFETGHPWMTFKDPCNIRSPQDHVGVIHNSNLCTEITLNTSKEETAVCNLGSINFAKHITEGRFDTKLLENTIKTAVRMLDNVIDINFYPTDEGRNSNLKHRPIGMGLMGFQDALYLLDINFDSEQAVEFADQSMELVSYFAIKTSSELAKEKGAYESFKGSKWDRGIFPVDTIKLLEEERGIEIPMKKEGILDWSTVREHVKQYGMRNSNVMAIAPTATISTISGCYPCIEPIFKNIYVKANMSGEFTVVNPYLIEELKKQKLWDQEMLDKIKYYDGNISMIPEIPLNLKEKYKEVFDIDPLILIRITAARGKWIDQSQSFNIFIRGVSGKKLNDTYLYAWQMGLKTTYYLRSLGASQIEKSTLDAKKFGYTQKREYQEITEDKLDNKTQLSLKTVNDGNNISPATDISGKKVCSILDPDCEACQ